MTKQHHEWGGMEIADHCRAMQAKDAILREHVTHYDMDTPTDAAWTLDGPNVRQVAVEDKPARVTVTSLTRWMIAALCVLAVAAVAANL